jgi:hypothetical protein
VSWRLIGARNDRFDWVAKALGLTFVDPNSWLSDGDFAIDGLHLNGRGKIHDLDNYMLELVDLMLEDRQGVRCNKFGKMGLTERGIPGKRNDQRLKNKSLYMKKMDQ